MPEPLYYIDAPLLPFRFIQLYNTGEGMRVELLAHDGQTVVHSFVVPANFNATSKIRLCLGENGGTFRPTMES